LPTIRFNYIEVKTPDGYPVHNLNTGLSYATIQEAIDAPETLNGHTILVEAGTYYENVVVSKSISLIGQDRVFTIIDGNLHAPIAVIRITAGSVNFTGFTVRNGVLNWDSAGIEVDSDNCFVSDNILTNNTFGIHLKEASSIVLRRNIMSTNKYNFGVDGNQLSRFIHDIDASNQVNGKPLYYLVNQKDVRVPSDAGYVGIVNSTGMLVADLDLKWAYRSGVALAW